MRYFIIATQCLLAVGIQLSLKDIAKHLNIISAGTIAFTDGGIDITLLIIKAISQTKFRKKLAVIIICLFIQGTPKCIGSLLPHHICRHCHIGR